MRRLLVCLALPLCGLLLACGGGDGGLSTEAYVEEAARALASTGARVEEIATPLDEIGGEQPVDQQIEAARTYLSDLVPIADELVAALEEIGPPPEAEAAHEALIAAWEDVRDRGQETLDVLESATTLSELEGAFGLFLQDSSAGVFAACRQLQDVAERAGLAVDFACET